MFRSLDHPQGANNVPSQSYMLEISYYIICFSDAAAYHVYVCMLYPLQGGRSTEDHLRIETGRSVLNVLV